jgi:hypothetical protein
VLTALKTGLSYQEKWFGIRTYFQRIDPDYRSMGIYFVNNDLQAFNVSPSLILFQNTLRLNGSLTFQRDNLLNQKAVTTRRTLPQVSVSYNPNTQWGLSATYTNMSTLQQEGALPLDNAFKMNQNNPIYTLTANYNITDTIRSHTFSLFANRSELNDNNLFTQEFANYIGNSLNLSYNYSHFSSGLGLYGAFNANNIETFNGNLPGTGFSVGANKTLQENDITLNANLSMAFQDEINSQNFMLGANYRLNKHTFSLNINYLNTIFQGTQYNEFTGFIEYGISF